MSQAQQQRIDAAREVEQERDERQTALSQASEAARMDQGAQVPNQTFFSEYGRADLSAPPTASEDDVIQVVSAELSHHNLYGNITPEERDRLQILNAALAMQIKAEFPAPMGASSKCVGRYRAELFDDPDEANTPILSADMAREIESAVGEEGVRSQMQSQSVNASAWKGITQIQSVAHTVGEGARDAAGGVVSRAKDLLFGGGD